MAGIVSRYKAAVVIMHMKGSPRIMQDKPVYGSLIDEIVEYLDQAINRALCAGVDKEKIIVLDLTVKNVDLNKHLKDTQQELEQEKVVVQDLNAKNSGLKRYLKATYKRLNKSFQELDVTETKFEQLNSKLSLLKAENSALLSEKEEIVQENQALKVKLSSVKELKKAIRELKYNKVQANKNRGFLIKDGKSTAVSRIKIEVIPVSENNNEGNTPPVISK